MRSHGSARLQVRVIGSESSSRAGRTRSLALLHRRGTPPESPILTRRKPERIRAHVEFLASDALEGRDTGSRGHQIAANYVAAEFRKLGL